MEIACSGRAENMEFFGHPEVGETLVGLSPTPVEGARNERQIPRPAFQDAHKSKHATFGFG